MAARRIDPDPGTGPAQRRHRRRCRQTVGPIRPGPGSRHQTAQVTAAGAAWLASRRGLSALARSPSGRPGPTRPGVLPCGSAFDVVNVPALFGRRMLDQLWAEGPGSGPVAAHRGPDAAVRRSRHRPAAARRCSTGRSGARPVTDRPAGARRPDDRRTVPAAALPRHRRRGDRPAAWPAVPTSPRGPRWVVAPDTRHPWLPGPEVLLWACVRAARAAPASTAADIRFFLPPIRMLRSTTSAGAASSVG